MGPRRGIAILTVIAGVALLAATRQAAGDDKIRLSIGIDPSMAMYLVAKESGMFKKHQIDAEIINADSGGAALEMTVAGQTSGATTTELPGIRARSKGAKIVIPAVVVTSGQWYGVVAAKSITKAEDLIGKKVAVHKGTAAEYYYTQFIAKHHLPADKIKVLYVASQEMVPALLRGDVDAYFTWEPWLGKGVETVPGAKVLSRGGQVTGYDLLVFAYITEDMAKNRDLAVRFMRALLDTERFIKDQRDQATAIIAKGFRLDPKLTAEYMGMLTFNVNLDAKWVEALKNAGAWMLANKLIEREPDYATFIVPDILETVAPERVTVKR
ncbi:MAG TPA: ABC transporter substrate-binding protein [Candidatus Methylomirabilis sp.]|nr:ABC transporter substrate-binding protein [Candidatus Methylomirabilis sp.]